MVTYQMKHVCTNTTSELYQSCYRSTLGYLHQLQGEAQNSSVDDIFGMLRGVWLK